MECLDSSLIFTTKDTKDTKDKHQTVFHLVSFVSFVVKNTNLYRFNNDV